MERKASEISRTNILQDVNVVLPRDLRWEGTMEDYFGKIIEHPRTVQSAHQRFYSMIEHYGSKRYRRFREDIVRWNIFDDPFDSGHRHAVYGHNVDIALMRFVNVLRAASSGLGQEHRMYLLHGPIGTAKSTVAELFSKGLEAYTKTSEGQLFAPFWVVESDDEEGMEILGTVSRKFERTRIDCPLHEEPLAVFPDEIRKPIFKALKGESSELAESLKVPTNACPQCADIFDRFMRRYNGDWRQIIEKHLRVKRIVLSRHNRIGIVVVRPKSEKDQDVTEFLGEHDFSKLGVFGSITDSRTFDFSGYYMAANRGFFYWDEMLKFATTFLYDLLGASQEHRVQPKGFRELHIDEVILGSTNEAEYEKLRDTDGMAAFRDRMIKIDVPYILDLNSEKRIYDKFFTEDRRGGKHLAPHTIETAALWAEFTRVEDSEHIDRKGKIRLYNGQMVPGFNEDSVRELIREVSGEGMKGISPRYINDTISAAFMAIDDKNCVNPFSVLRELKEGLRAHQHIRTDQQRKEYEELIALAQEELDTQLKEDLYSAIVGEESAIEELFNKFIDQATAFINGEKVKDPVTREDIAADTNFIREVLDRIDVSDSEDFCQKLVNAMHKRARDRERDSTVEAFRYTTDERLHKALQLYLFEQEKDKINWESLISRKSIDDSGQRRIDTIKERLVGNATRKIKGLGYCGVCAAETMTYVASIFKRGERAKDGKK